MINLFIDIVSFSKTKSEEEQKTNPIQKSQQLNKVSYYVRKS